MTAPRPESGPVYVPDRPGLEGIEARWDAVWEDEGIYRFEPPESREQVFSIDTPPPTVSGSLHVGHVFSYTHTDTVARYQRMAGRSVFYPMGWDDNGLPTERRVQNYYGVRCDPSLPYDPDYAPPPDAGDPKALAKRDEIAVSRPNFIDLCERLTVEDEKAFEHLFRHLGLSVDWSRTYATIDEHCRRVSQLAFLENLERGEAYQIDAPSLWDVTFGTAVAQAELEDRERPGAYHKLRFRAVDGGGDVWIDTTRPELVVSCVALVAHPDDERYRPLIGATVRSPVFDVEVPVKAHELADPEKGTGAAMICTFGDTTDVTWWRELDLPVRTVIGRDGRFAAEPPDAVTSAAGRAAYARLAGRTVGRARAEMAAILAETGEMDGEPRPITHAVKFFEKGDRPLEIVSSRQWYIRNGGREPELRRALVERGREMNWVPGYMRARYESWIDGLNGDWLISRQRFFGVPIPLWYPVGDDGTPDWDRPIEPDRDRLPIDPSADAPPGRDEADRGRPGGFVGDPDVMDTWATSSLTPQIATGWRTDPGLHAVTYPMDMRPQGHDIIRTWLFSTAVRAHLDTGGAPFANCALSGWILDPDRKKMSKSKGNVVVPVDLLETYGADAVRYWAASGRPGTDTAFDEQQMKIGRRLAIKILNASKFVLSFDAAGGADAASEGDGGSLDASGADSTGGTGGAGADAGGDAGGGEIAEALDRSMLHNLADLVEAATRAFEAFDYARALERTESFFWVFTDDHLELVKARAYGEHGPAPAASARAALREALAVLQKLFAPFLPFVAEEVWRWWHGASVHASAWPDPDRLRELAAGAGPAPSAVASAVLGEVRRAKSETRRPLRTPVLRTTVTDTADRLAVLDAVAGDVRAAGRIGELVTVAGPVFAVESELEPPDTAS